MKQRIYILLFFILLIFNSVAQTITTSGLTFNPDTLYVNQGDTINFIFNNTHNAVEVDESTFMSNGATSNNGFNIPYGGGSWIADSIKTYYYVCQPHISMGMKGVIIAGTPPCNKNVIQELIGFNPSPVYDYWDWSYDTLTLTNTSSCDIRVRPEFEISHDSLPINLTDFDLKWYNPLINFWPSLSYEINSNGDAVGYWSTSPGDTSGYVIDQGTTQQVIIRVRFKPSANYGTYSAIWETKEVDSTGNFIQNLDLDSASISFVDCSIFEVDSSYSTDINCFNNNDGNAGIISIKNGSNQYSYNWSNGDTTNAIINLNPGNYYCIITDINWQECTDSIAFLISEPTELVSIPNVSQITCNGMCDGEIISNVTGGNLPYSFSWDGGVTWSYTDSIIENLCPGNHMLSVIDNNGCTENSSLISITEPNPINLSIDSLFNITSYGGNNGAIYISSNGGSGQLNTNWSSDNGFFSNNEDITNLLAGDYYLEITDINSCTYMDTIEITQPASLSINLNWAVNTTCFDSCNGEINITANGGNPTYTYIWTGPNGFSSTNNYLTNLCYGTYIITIDDGISTLIDTFNIYQPQPITSNLTADSIICHNGFAQAEINVWGGTQPFTYLWSNNDTSYLTNINHGSYTITASDINGCWISENLTLTNPDSIISTTIDTGVNCFGGNNGSITIIANGGTAPYNFSNNNGITYQNFNTFNNLSAGNYSFLISDINGCLGYASADIIEPSEITSSTTANNTTCYGDCDGNVSATALGGTPPYTYAWNNGSSNLCAGLYNVTIIDDNGCLAVNSAIVNEPDPLLINVWIDNASIVATSGFTSYQWYYAAGTPVWGETLEVFNPSMMGEYFVVVTDTNNCEADSYLIDYNISGVNNLYQKISIFPNPTNGILNITSNNIINHISVMSLEGNELLKVEKNNNNMNITKLDLSTFAKGIYFIHIEQTNQIINYKIVLQ